jgi:HSP20 family molecular chaperone IbpA
MNEIDETIAASERLHEAITGTRPIAASPDAPYAPIPPERDPVAHVEEQVDRLLYALSGPVAPPARAVSPPISIVEEGAEYLFLIDVPGVARDRLDLHVRGDTLVVAGRRAEPAGEGQKVRLAEPSFGAFRRAIRLPPDAHAKEMNARLKEGVLEIRIPRSTGSSRSVPVA